MTASPSVPKRRRISAGAALPFLEDGARTGRSDSACSRPHGHGAAGWRGAASSCVSSVACSDAAWRRPARSRAPTLTSLSTSSGLTRQVAHDARVERPFDLRERDEQMLAGQQILTAATRLVFGAGDDPQRALGQLREIEIEIFQRRHSWGRRDSSRGVCRAQPGLEQFRGQPGHKQRCVKIAINRAVLQRRRDRQRR